MNSTTCTAYNVKSSLKSGFLALSFAGVVLTCSGCGDLLGDSSSTDSYSSTASASSSCNDASYPDITGGYDSLLAGYENDPYAGQCSMLLQAAEVNRQSAIASCSAGDLSAATTYYSSYYKQSVEIWQATCK